MKTLEKHFYQLGFEKLQEKEDFIYFEKTISDRKKDETHQLCIRFDKKKNKINSMDTFLINSLEMKLLEPNNFLEIECKNELKKLTS